MDALETTNNTDTPEPQGSEQLSVEEAFFSNTETPETGTEAPSGTPSTEQPQVDDVQAKNDAKRFEFWQSQANKEANENANLRQQVQQMQGALQQANTQAPVQQQEQNVEQFPEPPVKPEAPAGFSRAEAMEDPNSASARYLNDTEAWRDQMIQYNAYKSEYQTALISEQLEHERAQRVQEIQRNEAIAAQRQQLNGVYNQVQGQYGLSQEEAADFVNTMSTPDSLSMDNLVSLYRLKKGTGQPEQQTQSGPSDTFNQQARAQQVPSPMGVLPSQQNDPQGNAEDGIMNSIIEGYKKNNPW